MNTPKITSMAQDLRKQPPTSPHEKLGGFVIARRTLVKCRAFLAGTNGEYNYQPCGLSHFLWDFTGITPEAFKEFVATGASDEEVDRWIRENTTQKDQGAIIKWNNEMRCLRLCDLSAQVQEYFETYIPQFCHPPSKVKFFFDVYDVEEGVL